MCKSEFKIFDLIRCLCGFEANSNFLLSERFRINTRNIEPSNVGKIWSGNRWGEKHRSWKTFEWGKPEAGAELHLRVDPGGGGRIPLRRRPSSQSSSLYPVGVRPGPSQVGSRVSAGGGGGGYPADTKIGFKYF